MIVRHFFIIVRRLDHERGRQAERKTKYSHTGRHTGMERETAFR